MNRNTIIILGAAFISALSSGFAQEAQPGWQFGLTVPVWAAGIDGDVTVKGRTQSVNIGFNDLKDHLDASYSLGLEARKGPLGFYGSFGYLQFSADSPAPLAATAHAESTFTLGDLGVSHVIFKSDSDHPFVLEGIAGLRYIGLDNSMEVFNGAHVLIFSGEKSRDLVDPIIGLRGTQFITQKLHADFAADIGGFGISDEQSDLDWSAIAVASYDFTPWFTFSAGYKILSINASNGSGTNEMGADVRMSGAIVAAKFKF